MKLTHKEFKKYPIPEGCPVLVYPVNDMPFRGVTVRLNNQINILADNQVKKLSNNTVIECGVNLTDEEFVEKVQQFLATQELETCLQDLTPLEIRMMQNLISQDVDLNTTIKKGLINVCAEKIFRASHRQSLVSNVFSTIKKLFAKRNKQIWEGVSLSQLYTLQRLTLEMERQEDSGQYDINNEIMKEGLSQAIQKKKNSFIGKIKKLFN